MAASSNPQSVKIARKRGAEEPPSTLIIQAREGETDGSPVYYVRKRRDISTKNLGETNGGNEDAVFAPQRGPKNELARRLFELKVKRGAKDAPPKPRSKRGRDDVATFVEQEQRIEKNQRNSSPGAKAVDQQDVPQYAAPQERPFKRPSRQPRAKKVEGEDELGLGAERPQTEAEKREMEALAQYLHEAALEEVKKEVLQTQSQPQSMATGQKTTVAHSGPKISGQKAREMHRRRVESNKKLETRQAEDTDMSDGDYIYDTYLLAPAPASPTSFSTGFDSLPEHASDVGYLVISPEDRDLWETYIDDLPTSSDDEQNSDEEDENAEDYYGADYPEDELSEDDEFGKGAYGYRRGEESEGEGYESDDAAWSDDGEGGEGGREVERMMNPFRYGRKVGGVT